MNTLEEGTESYKNTGGMAGGLGHEVRNRPDNRHINKDKTEDIAKSIRVE